MQGAPAGTEATQAPLLHLCPTGQLKLVLQLPPELTAEQVPPLH